MNLKHICKLIEDIETNFDVNAIVLNNISVWPLIRYTIWNELLHPVKAISNSSQKPPLISFASKIPDRLISQAEWKKLHTFHRNRLRQFLPEVKTAFFSQPVNLQYLPDKGQWFDRIVDPLFFLAARREQVQKCYLTPCPPDARLFYQGGYIHPKIFYKPHNPLSILKEIKQVYQHAGISPQRGEVIFKAAWSEFSGWYIGGKKVFQNSKSMKRIFVTCWYTPNMMGIIAAAKASNVTVIDVQHGKQGLYQAMYSWWTNIPPEGYQLLPDIYWCWGQPSCNHILSASPDRKTHIPIIGGSPWPDYYRQYLTKKNSTIMTEQGQVRILLTLQPVTGDHQEPIPEFLIDYLRDSNSRDTQVTFRRHPNMQDIEQYVMQRMKNVAPEKYKISDGLCNLFDDFMQHTHHITAFSSCCYEANMFHVPTLLFGQESKDIYKSEIEEGIFDWTSGLVSDLSSWLLRPVRSHADHKDKYPYIVASLSHANDVLLELGT